MTLPTIDVWPRPGTTVTLASGYVITASGAAALRTSEIANLLAGYRLLTWDPTGVNPDPSPIPSASTGGLVAASVSALNALTTSTNGAVCNLTSSGGGLFVWDNASVATIDNALCCGNVSLTGRWLRQYTPGYVSVDWFGAVGDGSTDDYAALQAAINAGTYVTFSNKDYRVGTPLTFGARKTFQGCGEKATIIRALGALSYVAIFTGDDATVEGISFHGNSVCTDAVRLQGCNGSRFVGCNFQSAKRHGVNGGTSNNNNVTFDKCNFRFVGTTLTTGTVTTTASSKDITFSVPVDLATIEQNAYISIPGAAPAGRAAGFPFIVEYWNSPTSAHCTFAAVGSATGTYTLYSGNGINEAYAGVGGNDNNIWRIDHCYAVGCSKAGAQIDVLYGPQMDGFNVDASYIGVKIGVRAPTNTVAPQGTTIIRGYFEGPTYDVFVETSDGVVITDPLASSGVAVTAPDSVGYQNVTLVSKGSVTSEGRVNELVNATTAPASTSSGTTVYVSSSGATNVVQLLPDNGGDTQGVDTFTKLLTFVCADMGGKTLTFKTVSGSTLINGVAGTTGLTVSGNYKRYTATWCDNLTGWVVV